MSDAALRSYLVDRVRPQRLWPASVTTTSWGWLELARMNDLGSTLVVHFGQAFGALFRHHMWVAVRRQRSGQLGVADPELISISG